MRYYCNPINVPYAYSFKMEPRDNFKLTVNREAADPSMVMYKDKYYIFASMTGCVWVSDDMATWEAHKLPENMPIYDYAPDARVIGEWLYFTASNRGEPCSFYRTKDLINGPYEEIKGAIDYWDPNLFLDDDGRMYLYYGCDNETPIWGLELNPDTMHPMGERKNLIYGDPFTRGYERFGENHSKLPLTKDEVEECFARFLLECGDKAKDIPEENYGMIKKTFSNMPYIEGAWMTKHHGKYYLQYACPGAEINVYANGVYVGDNPLGPFTLAENNPMSYKPGGFIPGAGHGSTMEDASGQWWHTATMRISMNHVFERRVGIWPAGFDEQGRMYCNQRFGDWPVCLEDIKEDPWAKPRFMLLSYKVKMTSSGCAKGHPAENAADENVQTWWKANSNENPWIMQDLGEVMTVNAVQINFADDTDNVISCPGDMVQTPDAKRYIDTNEMATRWLLEGSVDGISWEVLEDKREANTDLPHDLVIMEEGRRLRFLRLTITKVPYDVNPSISGLRVFGKGNGEVPQNVKYEVKRISYSDVEITASAQGHIVGYNILWGNSKETLYHSFMIMGECNKQIVGALVEGQDYYFKVEAFNENGISR